MIDIIFFSQYYKLYKEKNNKNNLGRKFLVVFVKYRFKGNNLRLKSLLLLYDLNF